MAGKVVQVIPPRVLDFNHVEVGFAMQFVLKRAIDASSWQSASLLVRITAVSPDMPAAGWIGVMVQSEGPSPDDPGAQFLADPIGSITLTGSELAPCLLIANLGNTLGSSLSVTASGERFAGGDLSAMLSVDLCLRNAVVAVPIP